MSLNHPAEKDCSSSWGHASWWMVGAVSCRSWRNVAAPRQRDFEEWVAEAEGLGSGALVLGAGLQDHKFERCS